MNESSTWTGELTLGVGGIKSHGPLLFVGGCLSAAVGLCGYICEGKNPAGSSPLIARWLIGTSLSAFLGKGSVIVKKERIKVLTSYKNLAQRSADASDKGLRGDG